MKLLNKIAKFSLKESQVPWVLLVVSLLAYGPMIWQLGFYWDDWEILFLSAAAETPADIFLYPFRPLHVLLDIVTVRALGFNPLAWHVFMLLIRFLGGVVFWQLLRSIWPNYQNRNAWAAILFVVFPSFLHQSMGVVYRQHFTTALLYLLSLWMMVLAFRSWQGGNHRRCGIMLALSLVIGFSHLFVTEYFAAMELLRPIVLLILLAQSDLEWKKKLGKAFRFWLPYLAIIAGYVVWRLVFVANAIDDPNQAVLFSDLIANPVNTLLVLVQTIALDLVYMLVDTWVQIFTPDLTYLASKASLLSWAMALIGAFGLYWLFGREVGSQQVGESGLRSGILLGIAGLLLGLVPAWMIGRTVIGGRYNTRFTIPALAGISLLLVSLIFYLISNRRRATILLVVLASLAIGQQVQRSNEFRRDWLRQTRLFWQIHWRAPEIKEGTAFLVDRALSSYTTTYPVAYAVNFMYADEYTMSPEHWWFEVYRSGLPGSMTGILGGQLIRANFHQIVFAADSAQDVLTVSVPEKSDPSRCVWFLSPVDVENNLVAPEMRQFALVSNLSQIINQPDESEMHPMFGGEPNGGWCEFFQKAELAAQFEDWALVNQLYDQTLERGATSLFAHEFIPYITGSAGVGDWDKALEITARAANVDRGHKGELCQVWSSYGQQDFASEGYGRALDEARVILDCE